MMTITVTNFHTVFGDVVRVFNDMDSALEWVKICIDNKVNCTISIT